MFFFSCNHILFLCNLYLNLHRNSPKYDRNDLLER